MTSELLVGFWVIDKSQGPSTINRDAFLSVIFSSEHTAAGFVG